VTKIVRVEAGRAEASEAAALLKRFFQEEDYDTPFNRIAESLAMMLDDPGCWVAQAVRDGEAIGIVTVTTMLYVEWGRLGEISDLYVLPNNRRSGVARALIEAAAGWCQSLNCSAISVVVTPEGEAKHGLGKFYAQHKFDPSGRTIMTRKLSGP